MFHNQLTEQEREHILAELRVLATDEILTAALDETYRTRRHLSDLYRELSKAKMATAKEAKPVALKSLLNAAESINIQTVHEGAAAEVVNSIKHGPPGEPAGRIAESTKKTIFEILNKSPTATVAEINEKLNGSLSNTGRVMKLLWTRKLVTYTDGKYAKA